MSKYRNLISHLVSIACTSSLLISCGFSKSEEKSEIENTEVDAIITDNDGLSDINVRLLVKGTDGFVYFASDAQVGKVIDGLEQIVELYDVSIKSPGLSHPSSISVTQEGVIFALYDDQIFSFDPRTGVQQEILLRGETKGDQGKFRYGLFYNSIAIHGDFIYLSTTSGLFRKSLISLQDSSVNFEKVFKKDSAFNLYVNSLTYDPSGNLLGFYGFSLDTSLAQGLNLIQTNEAGYIQIQGETVEQFTAQMGNYSLNSNQEVWTLGGDGKFYALTDGGLAAYSDLNGEIVSASFPESATKLQVSLDGVLYAFDKSGDTVLISRDGIDWKAKSFEGITIVSRTNDILVNENIEYYATERGILIYERNDG